MYGDASGWLDRISLFVLNSPKTHLFARCMPNLVGISCIRCQEEESLQKENDRACDFLSAKRGLVLFEEEKEN
jgi:hypothetical protein